MNRGIAVILSAERWREIIETLRIERNADPTDEAKNRELDEAIRGIEAALFLDADHPPVATIEGAKAYLVKRAEVVHGGDLTKLAEEIVLWCGYIAVAVDKDGGLFLTSRTTGARVANAASYLGIVATLMRASKAGRYGIKGR